nr:unnamed protein product [Callosobruchus analis]
MAINSRRI